MNFEEMRHALDEVFDQAIIFRCLTDYIRDYEIITHSVADPITRIPPSYDRYLFRFAVEVTTTTTVTPETWRSSLDDRLIDYEHGKDLNGYVWVATSGNEERSPLGPDRTGRYEAVNGVKPGLTR